MFRRSGLRCARALFARRRLFESLRRRRSDRALLLPRGGKSGLPLRALGCGRRPLEDGPSCERFLRTPSCSGRTPRAPGLLFATRPPRLRLGLPFPPVTGWTDGERKETNLSKNKCSSVVLKCEHLSHPPELFLLPPFQMNLRCRWAGLLCFHGNGWGIFVTLPSAL